MKLDTLLSNGPACISAEWLHELTTWETENDEPLPANQIVAVTPFSAGIQKEIAEMDSHPIAGPMAAGVEAALLI